MSWPASSSSSSWSYSSACPEGYDGLIIIIIITTAGRGVHGSGGCWLTCWWSRRALETSAGCRGARWCCSESRSLWCYCLESFGHRCDLWFQSTKGGRYQSDLLVIKRSRRCSGHRRPVLGHRARLGCWPDGYFKWSSSSTNYSFTATGLNLARVFAGGWAARPQDRAPPHFPGVVECRELLPTSPWRPWLAGRRVSLAVGSVGGILMTGVHDGAACWAAGGRLELGRAEVWGRGLSEFMSGKPATHRRARACGLRRPRSPRNSPRRPHRMTRSSCTRAPPRDRPCRSPSRSSRSRTCRRIRPGRLHVDGAGNDDLALSRDRGHGAGLQERASDRAERRLGRLRRPGQSRRHELEDRHRQSPTLMRHSAYQ